VAVFYRLTVIHPTTQCILAALPDHIRFGRHCVRVRLRDGNISNFDVKLVLMLHLTFFGSNTMNVTYTEISHNAYTKILLLKQII
jgi:hypothetical protein